MEKFNENQNKILSNCENDIDFKNKSIDLSDYLICNENKLINDEEYSVVVEDMSITWNPVIIKYCRNHFRNFKVIYFILKESNNPTLKDISVKLKPGELLAVVGPVGSGKVLSIITIFGSIEKKTYFENRVHF